MKKTKALLLISAILLTNLVENAFSQGEPRVFSTRFCTVFYEEGVDLQKVNRRIDLKFSDLYFSKVSRQDGTGLSAEDMLSKKFDAIFSRVQDILDMYPSKIHITVNIYRDNRGLDAAYEKLFNELNITRSFYVYKTNILYTTQDAITENILAHEMAHCIVDHYFVILPPRKIQEMLAVYADVHLKD